MVNRRQKFRRNKWNPELDEVFKPFHSISNFTAGVIKKYQDSEYIDSQRLENALRAAKPKSKEEEDRIKEKISKLKYYIPIFPDLYDDLAYSDYEPGTIEFKMCDKLKSELEEEDYLY